MEKLYYPIGEVARILGEQVSLVRFWNESYPGLFSSKRTLKGTRIYTKKDVETFRQLHYLVKDKGMTLDGAVRQLRADSASVEARIKVIDSLKSIRCQLMDIKKSLK